MTMLRESVPALQSSPRILVVEDRADVRVHVAESLHRAGYTVETAVDAFRGVAKLEALDPDLVLTELRLPGMDGLTLMRRVHASSRDCAVVVMTGHDDVQSAVAAMRQGAADCLTKPVGVDMLLEVVGRALERRGLDARVARLRHALAEVGPVSGMVGAHATMRAIYDTVLRVAPTRATVLVTGESGTGKGLVAQAIHEHSGRAPFVKLHCSAFAETLLESELFGHERGAFTGAVARREGRLVQAHGGTLFLDEIGELSSAIQVKLLRFLQERELERVGGNQTIKVDVRVVAATNRDLALAVTDGRFREDLYYRLNVVTIHVPPLRERATDIPLLAATFLRRHAEANQRPVRQFSDEALEHIIRSSWPGNVRELENAIERAVVICRGDTILAEDLAPAGPEALDAPPPIPGATIADVERYTILKTLEQTRGCRAEAARILGISTRTIQSKLRDYARRSS
jgi:DNA-binding NtrC family response regulator